jgi:hypothetical protein
MLAAACADSALVIDKGTMDSAAQSERLKSRGLCRVCGRADDGKPVVMLNLLAFKPDGGRQSPWSNIPPARLSLT